MKIRLVGKNLEDIRPLLALADFAEAGEGETPELVVTHGGDGALLWTEHRARRAQRFFRCSA